MIDDGGGSAATSGAADGPALSGSGLPAGTPPPGLLLALAALLAAAAGVAGRYRETVWMGVLLLTVAVAFGMAAGLALRLFWRGGFSEAVTGAGGRYVLFLGGVWFTAAEAYAFGVALDRGAPALAAAFLVPPVAVAGVALRSAASRVTFASGGRSDGGA